MMEDGRTPPQPPALHPDPRCEFLIHILMASFVIRTMTRLREAVSGGLDGALVLLELLVTERERHIYPAARAVRRALPRRSIAGIGRATGVPRETVRRLLAGLAAAGWVEVSAAGDYATGPTARERFALYEGGSCFSEFVWVASQVWAVHMARGEAVALLLGRQTWQLAFASQWRTLSDRFYPEPALRLVERLRRAEAQERERLAHPVDAFLCRHFKRLRRTFDGDLMLPLLIGEIALRNCSAVAGPGEPLHRFCVDPGLRGHGLPADCLRCNAHSLSLSTGVPEATIRRKVARLAARGWVRIAADHALVVDPAGVRAHSGASDMEALADMLESYRALRLCDPAAGGWSIRPGVDAQAPMSPRLTRSIDSLD